MATSRSLGTKGQYTCFAVIAVLGSERFDTIEIVPERSHSGGCLALSQSQAKR